MIYLDYNATTPIEKKVSEEMKPFINEYFGNPSSTYALGKKSKETIQIARKRVADLVGSKPEEIVFTSGGSESNNMVIKGVAFTFKSKGNHIITSQIEHPSVLNPCKYLEKSGYEISYLPVDQYGAVNPSEVEKAITDKTILISIMHSNNETGTLQPIKEIARIAKEHSILLHTDASQSIGKVPVDVLALGIDFLTIAGHKFYAPKGIGALYIRNGIGIEPLIHGAGHENGRRGGTENIIFEVALGKACELSKETLKISEIKDLTRYFHDQLIQIFGDKLHFNGHPENRLPNTLNVSFLGYNGHKVLNELKEVAASTGSACHSGSTSISPVLQAMGVSDDIGRGAVRFSLGRYSTKEEVDTVVEKLNRILTDEN